MTDLRTTFPRLGFALVLLAASPALATHVNCGDTIGPGTNVTLDGNVGPCLTNPALTLVGPVGLDMNGFEVSCDSLLLEGIVVNGEGARIEGGLVVGCNNGVTLGGTGRHRIEDVVTRGNQGAGFLATSDGNRFERNSAVNNTLAGFDVTGNGTRFTDNIASRNQTGFLVTGNASRVRNNQAVRSNRSGFKLDGNSHKLDRNRAAGNGGAGFEVNGADNNLKRNFAADNGGPGFDVFLGTDCSFKQNSATRNFEGFHIRAGLGCNISKNVATDNADSGFELESTDDSSLDKNRALGNEKGIDMSDPASEGNRVKRNVVLASKMDDILEGAACATNGYSQNVFGTSNDPCVE